MIALEDITVDLVGVIWSASHPGEFCSILPKREGDYIDEDQAKLLAFACFNKLPLPPVKQRALDVSDQFLRENEAEFQRKDQALQMEKHLRKLAVVELEELRPLKAELQRKEHR